MAIRSQRYYIEHIQMPHLFYAQPKAVLKRLSKNGKEFIAGCYNFVLDEDKGKVIQQTFDVDDFKAMSVTVAGGKGYALIVPPEATATYDCQLIGIANCGDTPVYRTIERMEDGNYCLCGWSPDGGHIFYGVFNEEASWDQKVATMESLLLHPAVA